MSSVAVQCSRNALYGALGIGADAGSVEGKAYTIDVAVMLTRTGKAMQLVDGSGAAAIPLPDRALTRLLMQARLWWSELREGRLDITTLAAREQCTPSYSTRIVRLAFLALEVVQAMLTGHRRSGVTGDMLTLRCKLSHEWGRQRAALLPSRLAD